MVKTRRGRSPSDPLVSITAAARMLQCSVRHVHRRCRQGLLNPIYKTGRGPKHFRLREVVAVEAVLREKPDLSNLAILASRALVIATMNEQKLAQLHQLLGLERKILPTSEPEVLSLYEQAQYLTQTAMQPTLEDIEEWAQSFFAIDENYLQLVGQYTACVEPWKVFLDLANKWANDRATQFFEYMPELKTAYDHLEASRKHLRVVAYMFCRQRHGVSTANDVFGTDSPTDKLLDILSN